MMTKICVTPLCLLVAMGCGASDDEISALRQTDFAHATEQVPAPGDALGTARHALVADIHSEQYVVTLVRTPADLPLRRELEVTVWDTQGDDPVELIILRKGVPAGRSSKTGVENPEDNMATVYLSDAHYLTASQEIDEGTVVEYISTRTSGYERIGFFGWFEP
jgi:hypothetical protein